jgi:hypothetical protein
MLLILLLAEYDRGDRTCERTGAVPHRVLEADGHRMGIVLILVHDQHRPAAVRPKRRIGGDEGVPHAVDQVAARTEETMCAVPRLEPLQIDHLAHEVLRKRLLDLEILVSCKEIERPG